MFYGLNGFLILIEIQQIPQDIFFLRHSEFLSYGGFTDLDC